MFSCKNCSLKHQLVTFFFFPSLEQYCSTRKHRPDFIVQSVSWSPYKFMFSRHVNRPWLGSFSSVQSYDFTLFRSDSLGKLWQHPLIHQFYIWSMSTIKSNIFIIYVTFHTHVCIYINLYTHCTYSNLFTVFKNMQLKILLHMNSSSEIHLSNCYHSEHFSSTAYSFL